MIIELTELRKRLKETNIRNLAKTLNLHFNTLYKIARGESDPSYNVLVILSDYFTGADNG